MAEDETKPVKPKRRQPRKRRTEEAPPAATPVEGEAAAPVEGEAAPAAAPAEADVADEPQPATAAEEAAPAETEPPTAAESKPQVVTIFGGSGFIGRRLVAHLLEAGATVKVATRHPESVVVPASKGSGSVETIAAGIGDEAAVRAAVAGSTAVVNLIGILHESGGQTFADVHVEGARRIAAAAKAAGVSRLVHMSALGASAGSRSQYARTKAAGEAAVREAFPEASIVRPSIVFGAEDDFFNRFAGMAKVSPALPLIGGGTTRFQPVYVDDVAAAIVQMIKDERTAGQAYELGGPAVYSFRELMEMMLRLKKIARVLMPVPFFVAEIQGTMLQMLPTPPLTRDQVELLKTDNVLGGEAPGLGTLGITATPLEAVLPTYL